MIYTSTNLDVLRSLAIILVVASHLLLDGPILRPGDYDIRSLGTLGVLIFFVHTCLVLMYSLDRQSSKGKGVATSFLLSRICRIYPLSVIVVVILSTISWANSSIEPTLATFLSNIFLVQNITGNASVTPVLWSLPFEFQMYLVLPTLYVLSKQWGARAWLCISGLWCASVGLIVGFWFYSLDFTLIRFIPCFLPGVLAFCERLRPRELLSSLPFIYVFVMTGLFPSAIARGVNPTVLSWFICLGLGFLVPRCREVESTVVAACCSVIARYSYGIYLIHDPVRYFCFHYLQGISTFAAWVTFICSVWTLSYFSYHFIERPGIEFGRKLGARLRIGPVAAERCL